MKKLLLTAITAGALALGTSAYALNASDNGSNYSGGWTDGSNGGTGFGAWSIVAVQGTGYAGNFIGNPAAAGISGMATDSFGMYANPQDSGARVDVSRSFASPLSVGDTFSFTYGLNWDSGVNGEKGFSLFANGLEVAKLSVGGYPGDIMFNGVNTGLGFGSAAMSMSFTMLDASTLGVSLGARDGGSAYTTTVAVTGGLESFNFYAYQMQRDGDQDDARQAYFNDLQVVPEPSTYALLAMSAAGLAGYVIRRRK